MSRYRIRAVTGEERQVGDVTLDVTSISDLIVFQLRGTATPGDFHAIADHLKQSLEGTGKKFLLLGHDVQFVDLEEVQVHGHG